MLIGERIGEANSKLDPKRAVGCDPNAPEGAFLSSKRIGFLSYNIKYTL